MKVYGNGSLDISEHNSGVTIGSLEGDGRVILGDNFLAVGSNDASTTFSGSITGAGDFEKTGSGKLTLTGASNEIDGMLSLCGCSPANALEISGGSFIASLGTDVDGGTLSVLGGGLLETDLILVDGALVVSGAGSAVHVTGNIQAGNYAEGSAAIEVSNGAELNAAAVILQMNATLRGDGVINAATTVEAGSRIAPGNSPGTLTFTEGLTLEDGAILDFELGTLSDLILVTDGTLAGPLDGYITLNLANAGGFAAGVYTLIDFSGAERVNFDADRFELGSLISGYTYEISLDGNQLLLTAEAIPEPSAALLAALAAIALLLFRQGRTRLG